MIGEGGFSGSYSDTGLSSATGGRATAGGGNVFNFTSNNPNVRPRPILDSLSSSNTSTLVLAGIAAFVAYNALKRRR